MAEKAPKRILLDHLRPDELWVAGGIRYLSIFGARPSTSGGVVEGALTWALPNKGSRELGCTVTISGIYCAEKALQIDEGAIEARMRILRMGEGGPVFLSARAGSRRYLTIALETRL